MSTNVAKQRLKEGRLALGLGLRQARTVDIAAAAATCGFDWLFIDMEHNAMDVDTAAQIAMAAPGMGITPLVRIPGHEHYHASRLLDNGAQGGRKFPLDDLRDPRPPFRQREARAFGRDAKVARRGDLAPRADDGAVK